MLNHKIMSFDKEMYYKTWFKSGHIDGTACTIVTFGPSLAPRYWYMTTTLTPTRPNDLMEQMKNALFVEPSFSMTFEWMYSWWEKMFHETAFLPLKYEYSHVVLVCHMGVVANASFLWSPRPCLSIIFRTVPNILDEDVTLSQPFFTTSKNNFSN